MTKTQKDVILNLKAKLQHGDILKIAEKSGFSREYVGKALNPENDIYNEKIIDAGIEVINERATKATKQLKEINTADA